MTRAVVMAACMAATICPAQTPTPPKPRPLRIIGAATAVLPVSDAAEPLKKGSNIGVEIAPVLDTNADKIYFLGEDQADIAIITRPLTAAERAPYPEIDFQEIQFGAEAAVLAVSSDVWESGVRALTKEQARNIYEGKIKNWKEIGGADEPIVGFIPEKGRGVWVCFIDWLYDDPATINQTHFVETKNDDEAKEYLDSTKGSITPISMIYAENNHLHALGIKDQEGKIIDPTAATVADQSYRMARPLLMVTKGRPLQDVGIFVEYMVGDAGQQLVHKYNYLTLKEIGIKPPSY